MRKASMARSSCSARSESLGSSYMGTISELLYPGDAPPSLEAKVVPTDGGPFIAPLIGGLVAVRVFTVSVVDLWPIPVSYTHLTLPTILLV